MRSKQLLGAVGLAGLVLLAGCGGFFPPNTTTTTTSTTGDYFYVANAGSASVAASVVGFSITSGVLGEVSSTATALQSGFTPTSVVVDRQDGLVYVGGNGAIYCFSIGTGGVLTAVSGGGASIAGTVESMATSPDGQWLLALVYTTSDSIQISVLGINTSTGVLATTGSVASVAGPTAIPPKTIRISPAGNFVAVALGTLGDVCYGFTTSTGVFTTSTTIPLLSTSVSDNALTFSANSNYLFVGSTGSASGLSFISIYPISSTGVLQNVGTPLTIPSGDSPVALETDSTGTYLYSANHSSASNISGYTFNNTTGKLTALTNSPFSASPSLTAMARDKSGDYMIATSSNGGTTGSNDVTLYGFDVYNAGQLDAIAVSTSGTDPAESIAVGVTH